MIQNRSFRLNHNMISSFLFILYLCNNFFVSLLRIVLGINIASFVYYFIFFICILFLFFLNNGKSFIIPIMVYCIVFLLFLFTWLIHPEYDSWFSHPVYGIIPAFLNPRSGIWAFLIIWLITDNIKMETLLKFSSWALFFYHILQFVVATKRGYWLYTAVDGTLVHGTYDMTYGYSLLLPVSFFGATAFLRNKKYYFPYAAGLILILLGGSRAAFIWGVVLFLILIPFKWSNISKKGRLLLCTKVVILLCLSLGIYYYFSDIVLGISYILNIFGLSSGTISRLSKISLTYDNGRNDIYNMALDLIKTGGPFGRGVYGDRLVIGQKYMWGYSHNIFLEALVSFGYVGGSVFSLFVLFFLIKTYKGCNTINKQIIFATFLTVSLRLLVSNSFWYELSFWALLAFFIKWNKDLHINTYFSKDMNSYVL